MEIREPGSLERGPWPRDNTSDFEPDSRSSSPTSSSDDSDYESVNTEDLDMYEDECVC